MFWPRWGVVVLGSVVAIGVSHGPVSARVVLSSPGASDEVAELCAAFDLALKHRPRPAVEPVGEICCRFKQLLPEAERADRLKITNSVRGAFNLSPPPGDARVQVLAADCLSVAGGDGLKALRWALGRKSLEMNAKLLADECRARLEAKAAVIEAIGSFEDPKTLPLLLECLQQDSLETIVASCNAINKFGDLPLQKRKPVVEQVIKRYTALVMQEYPGLGSGRRSFVGSVGGETDWTKVKMPINLTIQTLTGQELYTAKSWREWFRAHEKDREWPKGQFKEENPWARITSRGPEPRDKGSRGKP
ncbi:MAG: HEAT repeat domain-containing protein [Planctomycetota bacterium]